MTVHTIDLSNFSWEVSGNAIQTIAEDYDHSDRVSCSKSMQKVRIAEDDSPKSWNTIYHDVIHALHDEIAHPMESYPEHRTEILTKIKVDDE